jgi:glycosyltransferase involved in cell wall biosynthesis
MPKGRPRDDRTLLFAGRISDEKAPQLMLELASRMSDVRIVIAGDGPLMPLLQNDVARNNLGNVTLTGNLTPEQLGVHMQQCTAMVMTSKWIENSPLIMLEAMACGRCVIVPDHPPLREWIDDSRTGLLFASGDVSSLEQAAKKALTDVRSREAMERAALQLVAQRHETSALMAQLEKYYEEAIRRCALR